MKKVYLVYSIFVIFFILLFFACIYLRTKIYLNGLKKIKPITTKRIDNGPYILEDGTKIYEYNPSIFKLKNGDIVYVSRLTGHVDPSRYDTCKRLCKNYTYDETINKNFSIFPKNVRKSSSHSIFRNITKNTNQIIPFIDKHMKNINTLFNKHFGNEDPRIFEFNNKYWVYFHYMGRDVFKNIDKFSRYVIIAPLDDLENFIYLYTDDMKKTEKNWMPFEYNNELYFEYSIRPHIILKAELDKNKVPTGYCPKVFNTYTPYPENRQFGGGSPSVKIKINGNYYFLGITHTRGIRSRYTIRKNLFYIFRAEPPFDILWFGPEINMIDESTIIEFATSLIVQNDKNTDKLEDYTVTVSFGIEDCQGYVNEYKLEDVVNFDF